MAAMQRDARQGRDGARLHELGQVIAAAADSQAIASELGKNRGGATA